MFEKQPGYSKGTALPARRRADARTDGGREAERSDSLILLAEDVRNKWRYVDIFMND
ncbi:hypothetical protein H650_00645 (plasmid) [Enterobacter sp. R4-368]|nr:hypothetical protein H650_00645 [Enterobacter sp. R4-368]